MRQRAPRGEISVLSGRIGRVLRISVLVCLVAGPSTAAVLADEDVGKRMALVIGNGAYGDLGVLPNPANDASDLADALRKLHFDVTLVLDGDVDKMKRALRDFGVAAANVDVALFYYAGHGMAVDGQNYLVPVGAHIQNKLDLNFETLGLNDVRESLEYTDAKLKMVILDACRDNPLQKLLERNQQAGRGLSVGEGLAQMDVQRASGMFIAYATAPGYVALDGEKQRNSPFTKALLSHIDTPNVDVRVMFGDVRADVVKATNASQTPWTEEAMLGEFQFNPVAEAPAAPPPADDSVAWNAISTNPDPDPADLQAFLSKFPDSGFAAAARDRLAFLQDPAREATAWKALRGSQEVGTYEKFLHRYPDGVYADAATIMLQGLLWGQLAGTGNIAGMEAFIARFPDAPLAPVAREAIAQAKVAPASVAQAEPAPAPVTPAPAPVVAAPAPVVAAPAAPPQDTEVASAEDSDRGVQLNLGSDAGSALGGGTDGAFALDLSAASVARLEQVVQVHMQQEALGFLGYYDGQADGKPGRRTRRAVSEFQQAIGAEPTGSLAPKEIVTLISRAAETDAYSQNTMGMMLFSGAGVVADPAAAVRWYQRSADGRYGVGQYNLGISYLKALGVSRDLDRARLLLELALANGVPQAQAALEDLN